MLTDAHTQKLKIFSVLWQEDPLFNKLFVNTAKDEKSYSKTQFQVPKHVVLRSNIFKNRFLSKIRLYNQLFTKPVFLIIFRQNKQARDRRMETYLNFFLPFSADN